MCPLVRASARWHALCEASSHHNRGARMKLITAIIKPFKLDDVREALTDLGVAGMTVTEVKGFGRQKGQTEIYRGAEYTTNMVPKVKIEIVCATDVADRVVEAIQASPATGPTRRGKVFLLHIGRTGSSKQGVRGK